MPGKKTFQNMVSNYKALLDVYSSSLTAFEKNITGRMNYILQESENISMKNWNEIQMIYKVRNDIDSLNMKFKSQIIKKMASVSYTTATANNLYKRQRGYAISYLTKNTQKWQDSLRKLKNNQIYNFDFLEALKRIEKYLHVNLNMSKVCDISVSNFINTNIKYEGDSITTLIKRVIKEEKDAINNISDFTVKNKNTIEVIANTDTCNEALHLEIITVLNKLQKELVEFKNAQLVEKTPETVETADNISSLNDDEEMASVSGFNDDSLRFIPPDYEDDVDMTTSFLIPNSEDNNKVIEEFQSLKHVVYDLMEKLKFDSFFEDLQNSLKDIQNSILNRHAEEQTLMQLTEEESLEFKEQIKQSIENIERRIMDIAGPQQTTINNIQNLETNLNQTKLLLTATEDRILEVVQNEHNANARFQTQLLANYANFTNMKADLIKTIENTIGQIVDDNKGTNTQVTTLINEIRGQLQSIENIDTSTNYVTLNMIGDIIDRFNTTSREDWTSFMTTIIRETETFRDDSLKLLQEKYDGMFEANKSIIDNEYQKLLEQSNRLDAQIQALNINQDAVDMLRTEIANLNIKIEEIEQNLISTTRTQTTNYSNIMEELQLKFNSKDQPSEELAAILTKLSIVYDAIKDVKEAQDKIQLSTDIKSEKDLIDLENLNTQLIGLMRQRDEFREEFKELNAAIAQLTTTTETTHTRYTDLSNAQKELVDKMKELEDLLLDHEEKRIKREELEQEKRRLAGELKRTRDSDDPYEGFGAVKTKDRKWNIKNPLMPSKKKIRPLLLNKQGVQFFDLPMTTPNFNTNAENIPPNLYAGENLRLNQHVPAEFGKTDDGDDVIL